MRGEKPKAVRTGLEINVKGRKGRDKLKKRGWIRKSDINSDERWCMK